MSEPQQSADSQAGEPPERLADADRVEHQGASLERHDDESSQRDGDDVRADAIEARPVEMEQCHWDESELDREAGDDDRQKLPARAPYDALVATLEESARPRSRVNGDDGSHRRE